MNLSLWDCLALVVKVTLFVYKVSIIVVFVAAIYLSVMDYVEEKEE